VAGNGKWTRNFTVDRGGVGGGDDRTPVLYTGAANQQLAQQRALVAIEQALEARRNRALLSQAEIAPIQWAVILVLATLILVTIAFVHIDRRWAMGITLFIFSTALAICLVLLVVYDRPFGAGGFTVRPAVLRAVVPN
jgi:hypothetical protein